VPRVNQAVGRIVQEIGEILTYILVAEDRSLSWLGYLVWQHRSSSAVRRAGCPTSWWGKQKERGH